MEGELNLYNVKRIALATFGQHDALTIRVTLAREGGQQPIAFEINCSPIKDERIQVVIGDD